MSNRELLRRAAQATENNMLRDMLRRTPHIPYQPLQAARYGWSNPFVRRSIAYGAEEAAAATAFLGLRFASRMIPYVGWALLAWDLANLLRWWLSEGRWNTYGWKQAWVHRDGYRDLQSVFRLNPHLDTLRFTKPPGLAPPDSNGWTWSGPEYLISAATNLWGVELGEGWDRDFGVPDPLPGPQLDPGAMPDDRPAPRVMPWLDPNSQPVFAPEPAPSPMPWSLAPYRQPNPQRDPVEQRTAGHQVRPRPAPNDSIIIDAGGVRNGPPVYRPKPGRYTRERKFIATLQAGSLVGRIVNFSSEAAEWIDSFYKALPREVRTAHGSIEKMEVLYKHWDKIDPVEAFKNVVANEIEDRIFGALGRVNARASRRLGEWSGRPVGFQTGHLFERPNL